MARYNQLFIFYIGIKNLSFYNFVTLSILIFQNRYIERSTTSILVSLLWTISFSSRCSAFLAFFEPFLSESNLDNDSYDAFVIVYAYMRAVMFKIRLVTIYMYDVITRTVITSYFLRNPSSIRKIILLDMQQDSVILLTKPTGLSFLDMIPFSRFVTFLDTFLYPEKNYKIIIYNTVKSKKYMFNKLSPLPPFSI